MRRLLLGLCLSALACQAPRISAPDLPAGGEGTKLEGWDVQLELRALDDLPLSCFDQDALVITAREPARQRVRWAWAPGAPGELFVGRMRFELGDAGEVELPPVLRVSDGIFRSTRVRTGVSSYTRSATSDRTDVTLLMNTEGGTLRGSIHLTAARGCATADCAEPELRCEVSVGFSGRRLRPELVATAY